MILGFDDAVGCAAFAGDVAVFAISLLLWASKGLEDALQIYEFAAFVLHGFGSVGGEMEVVERVVCCLRMVVVRGSILTVVGFAGGLWTGIITARRSARDCTLFRT